PRQHAQAAAPPGAAPRQESPGDLCEVRGQPHRPRALELAAAGGPHQLLVDGQWGWPAELAPAETDDHR
ncbi:MAG: ATP-binding protein, partial [Rubrivivax sp.]